MPSSNGKVIEDRARAKEREVSVPEQPEEKQSPISFGRVNFPLSVVLLVIAATAFLHNSLGNIRTDLAVMNTKQEVRDVFYREKISELRQEAATQKEELQRQIKALEYIVLEVQRSVETEKGR